MERAAVFGATGATGRELVRELCRRGVDVRAVSRSPENLERHFGQLDVERRAADLNDAAAAVEVAAGCDLIFHCVGLPMERFADHVTLTRHTAAAMSAHSARGVLVTSYWSYGPGDDAPMSEDRGLAPGSEAARVRKEQEGVMLDAGACVARLPDFFGPGAEISPANDALRSLHAGKAVLWPGDPDAPRDLIFIPDAGRQLCELATREEVYGQAWNVPGSGAERPRATLELAARIKGVRLRLRRGRRWMLTLAGLFDRDIRAFKDVLPLYEQPAILDTTRFRRLVKDCRTTPYEEAIRRTFAWFEGAVQSTPP
ncbi:MAG: NAD(P)H-binding protein [Gemmatimonadales bacterium]|jgi:nucleoside-diphosphate-sugar epimerase